METGASQLLAANPSPLLSTSFPMILLHVHFLLSVRLEGKPEPAAKVSVPVRVAIGVGRLTSP